MANRLRGEVTLDLDRPRTFRLSLDALIALEEQLGCPYAEAFNALNGEQGMNLKVLRALLYAGLRADDPALTPEAVGDLFTIDDMRDFSQRFTEVMIATFGESAEKNEGQAASGTGNASAPSPSVPSG